MTIIHKKVNLTGESGGKLAQHPTPITDPHSPRRTGV